MHTIHTTEGFILKSVDFGEASKYFFIFSKDFGLIKVAAQGVRDIKSKLRFNLEDYSLGLFSVVRGREVWRLTSVEKRQSIKDNEKLKLISRIFSLLLRLLHGEEKNDLLFDSLKDGINFLVDNTLNDKESESFECIIALRILSALGYIGKLGNFDQFTISPYFTSELILAMSTLKNQAIIEINKSLKETHL